MNHNNWYKAEVIDERTASELLHLYTQVIENSGMQITYTPFVNGTYRNPISMKAYLDFSADKQVGSVELQNTGRIIISAKEFIESNLVPDRRARIEWNSQIFRITTFNLASKDSANIVTNKMEHAFIVVLNVVSDTINSIANKVS